MSPTKLSRSAVALGAAATIAVAGAGIATAAPAQPGTTDAVPTATPQPGTTDAAPTPEASPVTNPVQNDVPAAATYAVPQISQVAQPVYADAGPAVESVPEIQYVQGEPQIVYVDRVVDREVQVVEENGTLLLLDPEYQSQINPLDVADHAVGNYAAYDQPTRDTLNLTAAAATAGGLAGGVGGGLVGAAGTGITGAVAGGIAGAAASGTAVAPLCVIGGVLFPVVGGLSCVTTAAITGAAGGAAVGGAAGAGAGLVAGAGAGAAAGAAGAASLVPGGTHAVQDLVADTAHDTEDELRTSNGFRGLVGDKPSGLPGRLPAEESTDTRVVDGTTLANTNDASTAADAQTGEEAAPAPETPAVIEDAAPAVPQMPQPLQAVSDAVDASQAWSAGVIDGTQETVAQAVTGQADLPNFAGLLTV